jgi:farnesyl-diphosphate farnesyltransferase
MTTLADAHDMVRRHSTTWADPILSMPPRLNETITGTYLCLRAVHGIEGHPELDTESRVRLLDGVGRLLEVSLTIKRLDHLISDNRDCLPEVTLRLSEWAALIPSDIAPRALETLSVMATRRGILVPQPYCLAHRRRP